MKRRAVWTVPVFLGCVLGVLYWSGVRNIAGNGWMKQGGSFDAVEEGQYNSGKAEVEWTVGSESLKNSSTSVAEHIGEHVVVGTEDGSIPLKETVQIAEPVDYTDPFDVTRNLFYGPWTAQLPKSVTAGEEFEILFTCTYPDKRLCPDYFMVLFHGPTRQNILPTNFSPVNWTYYRPDAIATLSARWTIHDKGEYKVYAYPQFVYCGQWDKMDYPWQKSSVQGTPLSLTVKPNSNIMEEGYGTCSSDDIDEGRYLSTNPAISPREFSDMFSETTPSRSFVYAPYKCKIPPRTIREALPLIPTANHFLFIGDSLTRGGFCTRIWEQLHGDVVGSVCDYKTNGENYWDMKWGHKFTHYVLDNENGSGKGRNISFSFLWVAHEFATVVPTLLNLEPPPTHVVFNMGMWVAWEDPESLKGLYWNVLELMKVSFPDTQHIILRTPTSVNQAVQCYGEYNIVYSDSHPETPAPADSLDFRLGGSMKRHAIYEVARKWNQIGNSTFNVSAVDAWQLTDNRMETTSDGRHWIDEMNGYYSYRRKGIGEAEASIQDRILDDFINQRVTV